MILSSEIKIMIIYAFNGFSKIEYLSSFDMHTHALIDKRVLY